MSASRGALRHLVGAGLITEAGECLELRWELDPGEADGSTLDLHCGPAGESRASASTTGAAASGSTAVANSTGPARGVRWC